jgi:uncharacterized RDD family membrane protein YckC
MSEDADEPVNEGVSDAPHTSENAKTAEAPIPPDPGTSAPPPAPPMTEATSAPASVGKADVGKRVVAALIDFAIAFVMGFVPGVGQLLGSAYLVLRDGLEVDFMHHRSVGKQVMNLHVHSVGGEPLELMTSVKRNWIFALGPLVPLLILIPILGWIMIPFVGFAALALGITELVLALTDADGRRLGDKWANTMVVED